MVTTLEKIYSWLALPIYVWQGLKVRNSTIRMLPPAAPANVAIAGNGDPIKLLMIGDSSIAGVGVKTFDDCLSGQTPKRVAELTGRPVQARISGNNSATAGQIRDFVLPNLEPENYDYIVLSIGVNDAKNFHTGRRFCKEFGTLIYAFRARFPDAVIVWSGIVDLAGIPALPDPLSKILSIRSRILDKNGRILCDERGALAPQSRWQPKLANFSEDGFHCSAQGYGEWAEEVSDFIANREGYATNDE